MPAHRKNTSAEYLKQLRQGDPADHLRALLLEWIADGTDLSDPEIARLHNTTYKDSKFGAPALSRFRTYEPEMGTPPSPLVQEAIALAMNSTPEANWEEAYRRWLKANGRESLLKRSSRPARSA